MGFRPGNRNSKYLATSIVGWLVSPPHEGRDQFLTVVPPFADDDDAIELLSFRLMHGHYLYPRRIVYTPENLILSKCKIQDLASAGVLSVAHPHGTQSCTDTPSAIKCHEIVQVLSDVREFTITDISQRPLNTIPILSRIARKSLRANPVHNTQH